LLLGAGRDDPKACSRYGGTKKAGWTIVFHDLGILILRPALRLPAPAQDDKAIFTVLA
jgi:hypothetical protein